MNEELIGPPVMKLKKNRSSHPKLNKFVPENAILQNDSNESNKLNGE